MRDALKELEYSLHLHPNAKVHKYLNMKALQLSSIIITHFDSVGDLITNKKLQKLLYYIEAWFLVYRDSIIEEEFEAWVHGPVIPSVYHHFKSFGYSPLSIPYENGESSSTRLRRLIEESQLDEDSLDLMFAVLGRYSSYSSLELEMLSHTEQPWLVARDSLGPTDNSSTTIDKALIKRYYTSLIINE